MKEKIVFLNPSYGIPSPRNLRAFNIAHLLADRFEVSVVRFNTGENFPDRKEINITNIRLSKLSKYVTLKTFSPVKLNGPFLFLSRMLNYMLTKTIIFPDAWIFQANDMLEALRKEKPTVLVASVRPFSMAKVGQRYKQEIDNNVKLVLDVGDPLAFNAAGEKSNNEAKQVFEKEVLSFADAVIVTNDETKAHYERLYEIPSFKITTIPQGVDTSLFIQKHFSWKGNDALKIIYAGAFYVELRNPNAFFNELKNYKSQTEMTVFGNQLPTFTKQNTHVNFKGRVPQSTLAQHMSDSHILLFIDNKTGMQSPGKIFELLSAKKPILFLYNNEESITYKLAKQFDHIYFIENTPQEIKRWMPGFLKFAAQDFVMNYDTEHFSWKNRAEKFKMVIDELIHDE